MANTSVVRTVCVVLVACSMAMCSRPVIGPARTPEAKPSLSLIELWKEPRDIAQQDLYWGAARESDAPSTTVEYTVLKRDETGYSKGFDVVGPDQRKWDIKVGKEAQTEVVLSRILWALGYHQPETYYVTGWQLAGNWEFEGDPARFRLQSDHDTDGEWKWKDNPFSMSHEMNGLIAINLLLDNWDFKTSNNRVYRTRNEDGETVRRYVVQDLGASLGRPRIFPIPIGTRNEIDDFESTTLIKKVHGTKVELNYRGRHGDIFEQLDTADVVWASELMNRLLDSQFDDAFKAAGYEPEMRERFVKKIRAKIQEGLALRQVAGL